MNASRQYKLLIIIPIFVIAGCSEDDAGPAGLDGCSEGNEILFTEAESLVLAEFENADFGEGWTRVGDKADATGDGYMRWEGANQFSNPGNGLAAFKIEITNPGTYRFIWRSAVTEGDDPTESNDSWLRFPDAADFYGEKGDGSIVYPAGLGKSPTPEGASKNGWFKVYRSGNPLSFKWQARTSDNDAHDIYVVFDSPGVYTMEVSGRSHGHAIDKFALFNEELHTLNDVTSMVEMSQTSCL